MSRARRSLHQLLKIYFAGLTLVLVTLLISHSALSAPRPFRVVIDPGHGGSDEGTVFDNGKTRLSEKEVTLSLAREAARHLRAKGYDVILTRSSDLDLSLPHRTALANRLKADLFLSLHMNATPMPMGAGADGVETYILNNATDASSRRLAQLENSVLKGSPHEVEAAQGSDVALILKDLALDANTSESKRLACALQTNLVNYTSRTNRGIRQALFYVLLGADMPSVLVEAGFLNSARDRSLVTSQRGRELISAAITRSIEQYKHSKTQLNSALALSRCKVR
jgi:N-acetylmuramoyl-L-alanine amidase